MPLAPYQFELGPSVAFVQRISASPGDATHARYAIAPGLVGRAYLAPWLAAAFHYNKAFHRLDLSAGALGTGAPALSAADDLIVTTLHGSLQPVWQVHPRLRVFVSAGLGWGSVIAPTIQVKGQELSSIRQRRGVIVEAPFGAGMSWWVWPRWVSLSYEAIYAFTLSSTGDAYSNDIYVDAKGNNARVGPLPQFLGSAYHHLTISLTL